MLTTAVSEHLERLTAFEPRPSHPTVSFYGDARSNSRGRDSIEPFFKKEFKERLATYPKRSVERQSLEHDGERIRNYIQRDLKPSANGVAVFACSEANLFSPIQLDVSPGPHRLFIADRPHLYPLARLEDQYPGYAALLANTNSARLFVFATGRLVTGGELHHEKVKSMASGGWSQARFQRHAEHHHLLHAKETIEMLDRVVRAEGIDRVFLSGDEVILPLLREQMPKHLLDRVVDVVRLDITSSEKHVLEATLQVLREKDAESDREKVDRLLEAYRSGGLAVVGREVVLNALELGQVDELLIVADSNDPILTPDIAEILVTKAHQTSARTTFIEDRELLAPLGGVGAMLRFRID